ncbi:homoserine kinase [Frankia sp. CNm7]|uniref:Homoserine kinase n=1 Tax=Frankia nepalensis TaxID=1836974 RepID=A0A937RK95_9ACTN|nr:homoserine kinase [Frankia nepalensis]MBL7499727.1 homoserine kinase [Frankia nepalensis]MBL7510909.1 homoserine kinase [Frankia nepalensis]MBL7524849.1 homoserine kinase [Frankia nepalensis]MBL7630409.1 homoserine kinase [Frankia nepalensis]
MTGVTDTPTGRGAAASSPSAGAAPTAGARVRVPATSANLGPGFDAFGLALGYYDEVEVALRRDGVSVRVEGAEQVATGEDNLVIRSIRATLDELGRPQPGLAVRCVNRVPHGRGLGSSAAAIVAGVAAAWALDTAAFLAGTDRPVPRGAAAFDRAAALRVATAIEGHPDNVAAALFGGFTVAWADTDGPLAYRAEPVADLRPVAFVPSARTSTAHSRGRLPEHVAHANAAFSAGRAGLLALALTQGDAPPPAPAGLAGPPRADAAARARLLLAATEDRLHQPYRLPAVPESAALIGRLRDAGVAAVLSGSGPTVLALALGGEQAAAAVGVAAPGFAVLPLAVDRDGVRVTPLVS